MYRPGTKAGNNKEPSEETESKTHRQTLGAREKERETGTGTGTETERRRERDTERDTERARAPAQREAATTNGEKTK